MDIQLFAVRLDRPLTAAEADAMARLLPEERRNRPARDEALCAYAVLHREACALFGWETLPELCYGENGKPSFAEHPEAQFSLSHTRRAVLVGLHDEPLGVDIELVRPVSERTMRRVADTASPEEFFSCWVRREARAKRSGEGIRTVREDYVPPPDERVVYLDVFPGYAACLCTRSAARVAPARTFVLDEWMTRIVSPM